MIKINIINMKPNEVGIKNKKSKNKQFHTKNVKPIALSFPNAENDAEEAKGSPILAAPSIFNYRSGK